MLLNKTFPEAITQRVLGQFKVIAEARQGLDMKKDMALLCKCCAEGNVNLVTGSQTDIHTHTQTHLGS